MIVLGIAVSLLQITMSGLVSDVGAMSEIVVIAVAFVLESAVGYGAAVFGGLPVPEHAS